MTEKIEKGSKLIPAEVAENKKHQSARPHSKLDTPVNIVQQDIDLTARMPKIHERMNHKMMSVI